MMIRSGRRLHHPLRLMASAVGTTGGPRVYAEGQVRRAAIRCVYVRIDASILLQDIANCKK